MGNANVMCIWLSWIFNLIGSKVSNFMFRVQNGIGFSCGQLLLLKRKQKCSNLKLNSTENVYHALTRIKYARVTITAPNDFEFFVSSNFLIIPSSSSSIHSSNSPRILSNDRSLFLKIISKHSGKRTEILKQTFS